MEGLFVTYELALLAREKGFKGECLTFYDKETHRIHPVQQSPHKGYINSASGEEVLIAPLYQQLIDWLYNVSEGDIVVFYDPTDLLENRIKEFTKALNRLDPDLYPEMK